ncbi:MAG: hypothetical protein Q8N03_09870 [Ignavibacteria bacterium]|nr:hypothetical protein [Ignavibacteria bacterium]
MSNEINNLDQNRIFNSDGTELVEYFSSLYEIIPLSLDLENITIEHSEVDIDVRNDWSRAIRDRSQPCYIKGNRISYFIPYTGDKTLFFCRASTYSSLLPYGDVRDTEILISIDTLDYADEKIKTSYNSTVSNILQCLGWINKDLSGFNNSLKDKIKSLIDQRKEKLNKNISLINNLGYPLRRRENIPKNYNVPTIKKKIIPSLPPIKHPNLPPYPVLDLSAYEDILTTITNMSLTMERSPKTFSKLKEEEIRDHFLMVLNSQFEGAASGETFNYEGKTDILIREKNKNIFIAECKFWKGEKVLLDTITQLLGYISWRDTKTAILVFNKNKDFTNVLKQIPENVKSHPYYIKQLPYKIDTGFRFVFHHKDDDEKELILTILLFNIPDKSDITIELK